MPAEQLPPRQTQAPRITPADTSRRSLKALKRLASFYVRRAELKNTSVRRSHELAHPALVCSNSRTVSGLTFIRSFHLHGHCELCCLLGLIVCWLA